MAARPGRRDCPLPARGRRAHARGAAARGRAAAATPTTRRIRCRRSAATTAGRRDAGRGRRRWRRLASFLRPVLRLRNIVTPGPADQQETPEFFAARRPICGFGAADVLVFQTEPLERARRGDGPDRVTLRVSSSARDTDFTAKLVDVYPPNADYPDGYDMLINDSLIRCRYREGFEREVFMEPGEVVRGHDRVAADEQSVRRGHRIRLDVSSLELPAARPEPEHRRADRPAHAPGRRRAGRSRRHGDAPRHSVIDWVPIPAGPYPMGIDPAARLSAGRGRDTAASRPGRELPDRPHAGTATTVCR